MNVAGAALATSLARIIEMAVVVIMYFRIKNKSKVFRGFYLSFGCRITKVFVKKIAKIIAPTILNKILYFFINTPLYSINLFYILIGNLFQFT